MQVSGTTQWGAVLTLCLMPISDPAQDPAARMRRTRKARDVGFVVLVRIIHIYRTALGCFASN